jgi:non-specific serine/threonine protein kinase
MIGQTISHYRVIAELGRGGMGTVYRAEDLRLQRAVALKALSADLASQPMALDWFKREARVAAALNHPSICTIHDVFEADGRPFIVMELLEGRSLREEPERCRPSGCWRSRPASPRRSRRPTPSG